MLRKAVIMPKLAIVVTIAAAVVGQVIGSRLERARLAAERESRQALAAAPRPAAALSNNPPKRSGNNSGNNSSTARVNGCKAVSVPADPEGLGGQLACAMASLTHSPRLGRLLSLPVTPLKV